MSNKKVILVNDDYKHHVFADSSKYKIVDIFDYNPIYGSMHAVDEVWYMQNRVNNIRSYPIVPENANRLDCIRVHDITMLGNIEKNGINVPKWIHASDINQLPGCMEKDKTYMLKAFNEARSMGKMHVDKYDIIEMFNTNFKDYIAFNKRYNVDVGVTETEKEKEVTFNKIRDNRFYISELIDVVTEYRVLYFNGMSIRDMVVEERVGYAPNSKEKRSHKVVKNKTLDKAIREKLKEFGLVLKHPFISFDVYIDRDGNWGLFEYSVQFGIEYDKKTIKKLITCYNDTLDKMTS